MLEIISAILPFATTIGSITTPILVVYFGYTFSRKQKEIDRKIKLEEQLRGDRIGIYNEILQPYIIIFTPDQVWNSDPKTRKKDKFETATSEMLSVGYRKTTFKLILTGSDRVVKAHNDLLLLLRKTQGFSEEKKLKELMTLLGDFLLEIRRNLGSEATELTNIDMLEWFISDARELMES